MGSLLGLMIGIDYGWGDFILFYMVSHLLVDQTGFPK